MCSVSSSLEVGGDVVHMIRSGKKLRLGVVSKPSWKGCVCVSVCREAPHSEVLCWSEPSCLGHPKRDKRTDQPLFMSGTAKWTLNRDVWV